MRGLLQRIKDRVHELFRNIRSEEGYTLIEIMVVVTIIAILMGVVGSQLFQNIDKANVTAAKQQIGHFDLPLLNYSTANQGFPSTEDGLEVLKTNGLMKKIPKDPWGVPYHYQSPGDNGEDYVIWTNGKDKKPGGEGTNADIKSTD
ncbi:MAG: type II secretion system major pseudopilin GspG [bacterium]|nr:type II secretion system major pseudopilin GspG [bacterium]